MWRGWSRGSFEFLREDVESDVGGADGRGGEVCLVGESHCCIVCELLLHCSSARLHCSRGVGVAFAANAELHREWGCLKE